MNKINVKNICISGFFLIGFICSFAYCEWMIFNREKGDLPTNQLNGIAEDINGSIWLGTDGYGLLRYDGNSWDVFSTSNSILPDNHVRIIGADNNNTVYAFPVYSKKALIIINNNSFSLDSSYLFDDYRASCVAGFNSAALIGSPKGVIHYKDSILMIKHPRNSRLQDDNINSIFVCSNQYIWIGTQFGGLFCHKYGSWEGPQTNIRYSQDEGFPAKSIPCIAEDINGNILAGTNTSGLIIVRDTAWQVLDTNNSIMPQYSIRDIVCDNLGSACISTGFDGLIKKNGNNLEIIDSTNSNLPTNKLEKILIDKQKRLWIVTYSNGICLLTDLNSSANNIGQRNTMKISRICNKDKILRIDRDFRIIPFTYEISRQYLRYSLNGKLIYKNACIANRIEIIRSRKYEKNYAPNK